MKRDYPTVLTASLIVSIASLFYIYEFFLRVTPSVITHELQMEFHANLGAIGAMSAAFGYAYALMQIPSGLLTDRYGPKRVLTVSVLICSLATIVFMQTHDLITAGISRLFIGAASACAFIAPLTLTTRWFRPHHFALVAGLVQLMGCVGSIVGQKPMALLTQAVGWRMAMFYAACTGLALAVLFWLGIRDWPGQSKNSKSTRDCGWYAEWQRVLKVIRHRQTWYIAYSGFACWAPIGVFAELYGPRFLNLKLNINTVSSADLLVWLWLAIGILSPAVGWWSDRIGSRKIPLLILGCIGLTAWCALVYAPDLYGFDGFFLILLGLSAAAQPVTFALVKDNQKEDVMGTAIGLNNMAVASGAFLMQPLVGLLLDYFWSGSLENGVRIYNLHDFQLAFSVVPLVIVLGLVVVYCWVDETHCQHRHGH